MDEPIVYIADEKDGGRKLREVLKQRLGVSRRLLIRLKGVERGLTVNGVPARTDRRVFPGDVIELRPGSDESEDLLPQPMELDIVYEDGHLLVLNKPPGLVVHPTKGHYANTLANGVVHYWRERGERCGFHPVHRLDVHTSGLVMVAKHPYAHQQIARQMEDGTVTKRYCAFVYGSPPHPEGEVNAPIGRLPGHPRLRAVVPDGAPSLTRYAVTTRYGCGACKLSVSLATGRTHQIRVHMQFLGCPLIGDPDYVGDPAVFAPLARELAGVIDRQALHASYLAFRHPVTGERMELTAPLPDDMRRLERELTRLSQSRVM